MVEEKEWEIESSRGSYTEWSRAESFVFYGYLGDLGVVIGYLSVVCLF